MYTIVLLYLNASGPAVLTKMLIDTSVLLGLARDPKDAALIQIIETLIERRVLSLIVPSVVLREFLSGRERVAAEYGKRLTPHFRIVKDAVMMEGGDQTTLQATLSHLDRVDQDSSRRGKLAAQIFRRLEAILLTFPAIEPSEAVKARAFERSLDGRAPFHRGNNSAADAIIIETYAELVREGGDSERFVFVTLNTRDFSSGKETEKKHHADYTCFADGRSDYFIDLPSALRTVEPALVTEMLGAWELEQPTVSDLIRRYLEDVQPIGESHRFGLAKLSASRIGQKIAPKLRAADVIEYGKQRRGEDGVAPSTVLLALTYLRGVFLAAERDWGILGVFTDVIDEARRELQGLQVVSKATERTRRPQAEELEKLFADLRKSDAHANTTIKMVDVMEFALASGRARDEIFNLRWGDFDQAAQTCVIHRRASRRGKGDSGKPFPLRDDAVRIILRQPRRKDDDPIFAKLGASAGKRFIDAKKRVGITGLRFHDLRREAVMRMMEARVPLHQIEAFTGLSLHMLERYRASLEADKQAGALATSRQDREPTSRASVASTNQDMLG